MAKATEDERALRIVAAADGFGAALKDTLVSYLRDAKKIEVEDLGVLSYYKAGEAVGHRVAQPPTSSFKLLGLVVCGTGVGVSIFANKFPGVYAAPCDSIPEAQNCRSINNSNVLTLGAKVTSPDVAISILETWLSTPFKSDCPANDGKPWPPEIQTFLDESLQEMAKIPGPVEPSNVSTTSCAICNLAAGREFKPVDIMPGASMQIVREDPTSAIVRFKAGSVEPKHHHTFGHDLVVLSGSKRVWNVTKDQVFDLEAGDYLYTPSGDLHRVYYKTDTEFFIRWDGHWDIFLDEDLEAAKAAVANAS